MDKHIIKTTKKVIPMCYAYTTPGVTYHEGWTKIGYTERDVHKRIKEQLHTSGVSYKILYQESSAQQFVLPNKFFQYQGHQ